MIDKPLAIFVGGKVTKSINKEIASDVVEVLKFLESFVKYDNQSTGRIKLLLDAKDGLNSEMGYSIFRNAFRETCTLAGLDEWYSKSNEAPHRTQRKLHRLTTHSLRHYFITRVYKTTKDPVVAQKLARHTNMRTTQIYIHTAQNDLDGGMEKAFERSLTDEQKDVEDMKKLVEILRILR